MSVFACAGLAIAVSPPANAYLYWTTGVRPGVVDRAALNGSDVTTPFLAKPFSHGLIFGLALGGSEVYYSGDQGLIGRASLQGGEVEPFFTIPQPAPENLSEPIELDALSLAVGGGYVYWCTDIEFPHRGDYYDIGRATLGGSDIEPEFIKLASPVGPVRAYESYIYWHTQGAIGRARLNGSDVEPDLLTLGSTEFNGFTVAHGHIYWTSGHTVGRADLDGHDADPRFITHLGNVGAIAVAGGAIYWLEGAEGGSSRSHPTWIGRATIAGGGVRRHFITFLSNIPEPSRMRDLVADTESPTAPRRHPGRHRADHVKRKK